MIDIREFPLDDYEEVVSTNIKAVGVAGGYLVVQFNSGLAYRYPGLSHLFHEMVSAPSVGKFFAEHVRKETCERVCGEWPDA